MSARLRGYAGTAAVVAGILFVLIEVLFFLTFIVAGDEADFAEIAGSGWWPIIGIIGLLGFLLALLAVIGLYRQQAEESGGFGLFAAGLFCLGLGLVAGAFWTLAFVTPWLAAEAPELLAEEAEGGFVDVGFMVSFIIMSVGALSFAISTWLAKVYPRWPAVLLALTGVLGLIPQLQEVPGVGVLAGVGFVGYGLALRKLVATMPEPAPTQAPPLS